ncbi:hypothetical protein [Tautonia marina]|uniref:hypothetical protein n=1 Tax=Tautonia marina TaxID=2653855 RepID=UPI0012611574|nr:hypothetical protein [Tautonia marina]
MTCWLPLLLGVAGLLGSAGNEGPSIRLAEDGAFEVVGLDASTMELLKEEGLRPKTLFTVAVLGADVPMLGRLRMDSDRLRFEPRYAIRPGTTYRATFRPGLLPGADPDVRPIEADLALPDPADSAEPTRILAVYPSGDQLPENLLRVYVHFSAPMSRGEVYRHLQLLGPDGDPVPSPFLELDEELWDPSGTRLTLLIDPGRIKQGLVPREELGPVLEAGQRYTLQIGAEWPDSAGRSLAEPFRKVFETLPADEVPPDPSDWQLATPMAGSREPLRVQLPEPLDHALMGRLVFVSDEQGRLLSGQSEVTDHETRWSFTPDAPWRPGRYLLVADTDLEDLAGNGIGRPFEVDVFERIEPRVDVRTVSVPFQVAP